MYVYFQVTKLQDTIDKESEYKSELMKAVQETQDGDQKRIMTKQIEKCDEKMEALMMMMVHYCAGLQHCLGKLVLNVLAHLSTEVSHCDHSPSIGVGPSTIFLLTL